MLSPFASNQYCSILSEQAGESLVGSAAHTETYLLLEYPDSWDKQAVDAKLPEEVKAYLKGLLVSIPRIKFLLVRGSLMAYDTGPRLFLVRTGDPSPAVYRFQLGDEHDLLKLDLEGIIAGEAAGSSAHKSNLHRWNEPVYLVCTHGRRDACCAKFGIPIYNELVDLVGENAWQSSHLGGHRFAPNLLILPHGLLYARLGSYSTRLVVDAYQRGEVLLDHLRGRSAYPQVAQAADIFLRRHRKELRLEAFIFKACQEKENGTWLVEFEEPAREHRHLVEVGAEETGERVFESCLSEKQAFMTRYTLIGLG